VAVAVAVAVWLCGYMVVWPWCAGVQGKGVQVCRARQEISSVVVGRTGTATPGWDARLCVINVGLMHVWLATH